MQHKMYIYSIKWFYYIPNKLYFQGKVLGEVSLPLQLQQFLPPAGGVGGQPHACLFEHEPRRHAGIGIVVLVAVVHHLGDAGLDDGLGALVAGEEGHVDPGTLQVVVGAVQDGVELRMADVHVLRVQRVALALPWHGIVIASNGHSVVAQGEDLVLRADNAGSHLAAGVLGAHGGEQGDAHKVFIPVDVIGAFHGKVPPSIFHWVYCTMPTHVLQSILRASGQNAQKNSGKFGGQMKENFGQSI